MHPWIIVAIASGIAALIGVVSAGPAWRRGLGLVLGAGVVALPWASTPGHPTVAFVGALVAGMAFLRSIDLARDRSRLPVGQRMWLMVAAFDSRRTTRRAPGVSGRQLGALALALAIAVVGFVVATDVADRSTGDARWAIRWLAGAVFAASSADAATRLITLLYGLGGIATPKLHDAPHLARTIAEFWFARWNKSVGTWLRLNCFQPLARRRRPRTGLVAAFVVSTVLHVYLTDVALGLPWALVMGAFFLVQIVFILAEQALHVRAWPPIAQRTWTLGVLTLASPLFVEPFLRVLGR